MSVSARPVDSVGPGPFTAVALRDITEELRAKRELARSEEQFRMAMHGAPEGMAVTDAHDQMQVIGHVRVGMDLGHREHVLPHQGLKQVVVGVAPKEVFSIVPATEHMEELARNKLCNATHTPSTWPRWATSGS